MNEVTYLDKPIVEIKTTETPRYGMCQDGYTLRSGAPTSKMIRLKNEKRWRRLMIWQFSNIGTVFVKIGSKPLIVREYDLPINKG